jgi:uncharacterized OB-fold protein
MTEMKETVNVERALPPERTFSKPFWDGTREKKVMLQYDRVAKGYQFFPRPTSIYTGRKSNLEWREVSGKGQVFSFTIARRVRRGPFSGQEPFLMVLVTLDEGVNVMSNVVNCTLEQMKIGLRMKPFWAPLPDGRNLLMFEPDID